MAIFSFGNVSIRYEEFGSGRPVMLFAPGALESTVEAWVRAPVNPLRDFPAEFRFIAMDQRNAGASSGPFPIEDPWRSYADDQLALADHLGLDRFCVMGACIGCNYALKLTEVAPDRVIAAVLEQPVGVTEENKDIWLHVRRTWVSELVERRPDLNAADGEAFGSAMWDGEFVLSVTKDFVRTCTVPMLLLPGRDVHHPLETSQEIAEIAPNLEVLAFPWRDTPEQVAESIQKVRSFLHASF